MPSDLLELTRQIHQAPIIGAGLAESMIGSYRKGQEIEQMRREMEAQQQLRQLFAQGQQPTLRQIGAVNPELALKYGPMNPEYLKMQTDIMRTNQQMQETQQKMEFERLNRQGLAVTPFIDEFHQKIAAGMPEKTAIAEFNAKLGEISPMLDQMGIGFRTSLANGIANPYQLENTYAGFNAPTMRLKQLEAQNKSFGEASGQRMVPSKPTFSEAEGRIDVNNGYPIRLPGMGDPYLNPGAGMGGGTGGGLPQPQPTTIESGTSIDSIIRMLQDPSTPQQDKSNMLKALERMVIAGGGDGGAPKLYTPEEARQKKAEDEAKAAALKKEAELKTEDKQAFNKNVNVYEEIPDIKRIDDLIDNSIGGDLDYWVNRVGNVAATSLAKGDNTAALKVIAGQLVQTAEKMPGAQSDQELKAKIASVGGIDQMTSPSERKTALHELVNVMDRRIANRVDDLDITEAQAVRLAKEGKISKETLAAIHRQHSKKWGR